MSAASWQVWFRRSSADAAAPWTAAPLLPFDAGSPTVEGLDVGVEYDFRIRFVDEDGDVSQEQTILGHLVAGQETTPPNPAELTISGESCLRWRCPIDQRHVVGFLIRYAFGEVEHWPTMIPAHDGVWPAPPFPLCGIPGGLLTFAVVAVGVDGRESAAPAYLPVEIGDLDDRAATLHWERSEVTGGWPGEIAGGTVISNEIRGSIADTLYGPEPLALYGDQEGDGVLYGTDDGGDLYGPDLRDFRPYGADDPLAEYGGDVWQDIVYTVAVGVPSGIGGAARRLTVGATIVGRGWRLEYRHAEDLYGPALPALPYGAGPGLDEASEPYGDERAAAWRPWPGLRMRAPGGRWDFRVVVPGGEARPKIQGLTFALTAAA